MERRDLVPLFAPNCIFRAGLIFAINNDSKPYMLVLLHCCMILNESLMFLNCNILYN